MRIALIQDQLLSLAGSERVFLHMLEEFPEADAFTLCYQPNQTWPGLMNHRIHTSFLNPLLKTHDRFKLAFPLATYVMQYWDFRRYDLIVTSSATTAKYISRFRGKHVCYCYYPTRAIWEGERYFGTADGARVRVFKRLLPYLKSRDVSAAQRVDHFIAISESSRKAIQRYYRRDAEVLFAPIEFDAFAKCASLEKEDFFLLVSRLEKWKLLEYAIEAFNSLGLPLRIVGKGEEEARLRAMANDNVEFLGGVPDAELAALYAKARAVIFTPELDYGLVPLEAYAAGTPVISLGRGGVAETMIPIGGTRPVPPTPVFFAAPTSDSLSRAVKLFEECHFDRAALVAHAKKFSPAHFRQRLRE